MTPFKDRIGVEQIVKIGSSPSPLDSPSRLRGQGSCVRPIIANKTGRPKGNAALALLGRTIHPGQQGGLQAMRAIPRYVKLIEKGRIDATSMITKRYTLENSRQAVQDTADRTIITGVIAFA